MKSQTVVLKIKDLTFSWDDALLFENISAEIAHASVVRLIGANGSGKTTLLKLIAGALPHFARGKRLSGNIFLFGSSVFANSPRYFFPDVAYIPDSQLELFYFTKSLSDELTIVQAAMRLTNLQLSAQKARFSEYFPSSANLFEMGFDSMNNAQRQLALLFIFYLQNARLFLVDEILPTAGISDNSFSEFFSFLKKQNKTVVFVSQSEVTYSDIQWKIESKKLAFP